MERYDSVEQLGERLTYLISNLKLKRKDVAAQVKLSESSLSTLCAGKNGASERTIDLICKTYNINREWLCWGRGDIFVDLSKEEEVMTWVHDVLKLDSDSPQMRILSLLAKLPEEDWQAVNDAIEILTEGK